MSVNWCLLLNDITFTHIEIVAAYNNRRGRRNRNCMNEWNVCELSATKRHGIECCWPRCARTRLWWQTRLTCLLKTAMSSLKDSDEQTSPPWTPGSLGVHVASSHFSNTIANSGNSGWLEMRQKEKNIYFIWFLVRLEAVLDILCTRAVTEKYMRANATLLATDRHYAFVEQFGLTRSGMCLSLWSAVRSPANSRLEWSRPTPNLNDTVSMIFDIVGENNKKDEPKLIFMFAHSAHCSVTEQRQIHQQQQRQQPSSTQFHLSLFHSLSPFLPLSPSVIHLWINEIAAATVESISKSKHYDTPTSTLCNNHLIYAIKSYEIIIMIWKCARAHTSACVCVDWREEAHTKRKRNRKRNHFMAWGIINTDKLLRLPVAMRRQKRVTINVPQFQNTVDRMTGGVYIRFIYSPPVSFATTDRPQAVRNLIFEWAATRSNGGMTKSPELNLLHFLSLTKQPPVDCKNSKENSGQ